MNFRNKAWALLGMVAWGMGGAQAHAVGVSTNVVVITNAPTTAVIATNVLKEAKPPGNVFTNALDMVLLKVGEGLWAGKYEVTQKEFQKLMSANPSAFVGASRPVDSVNWIEAMEFCRKLTELDVKKMKLPKGFYYRLPTETEWTALVNEAGMNTAVTSVNGASRASSSPVGSLAANRAGLYDVRGNVMEFCLCDASKPFRYLKGGSWQDFVEMNLRPEFRWYCKPDERKSTFGFRCVLKKSN